MITFWIIFIGMGILFVPFAIMFAVCGADTGIRIGGTIVCIALWLFTSFCFVIDEDNDAKVWNNGNCSECGGEYVFSGASEYRGDTDYYYTCEDCHHTIETNGIKK
jgi:hypothetical protein